MDGSAKQISGKLHYVTMAFNLEIRDAELKSLLDEIKPLYMDNLLNMLGRKTYADLTSVQGRYVLRNQIMDLANKLIAEGQKKNPHGAQTNDNLVTNVYLTSFVVQ
jgi:flagellar basal body-associated protein FliL